MSDPTPAGEISAENAEIVRRVLPDNADWHFSECIYMAEDVEALLNAVRQERDILLKLHQNLMPLAQMCEHTAHDFVEWLNLTQAAADSLNAARAIPPGFVLMPEEPSREMWAEMGDAVLGLSHKFHGAFPAHDLVSEAVYHAALIAARPQGGE